MATKKKNRTIASRKEEIRATPKLSKKTKVILGTLGPGGIVKKSKAAVEAAKRAGKRFKALLKKDPKERASFEADKLFQKRMEKLVAPVPKGKLKKAPSFKAKRSKSGKSTRAKR